MFRFHRVHCAFLAAAVIAAHSALSRPAVAEPASAGMAIIVFVPDGAIQDFHDLLIFTGGDVSYGTLVGCEDDIQVFQEAVIVHHGTGEFHRGIVAFPAFISPEGFPAGTRVSDWTRGARCIDADGNVHSKCFGTTK